MAFHSHLLSLFVFALFFLQIHSHVICEKTHRGCPKNYACSDDGIFCLKNNDPNLTIRSSWSLLEIECVNVECGPNSYCLDHRPSGKKCVKKDISSCDFYLEAMNITGCNNSFLTESFEACGNFYLNYYDQFYYNHISVMQCKDQCTRDYITHNILRNKEDSCNLREQYAVGNYSECFYYCEACSFPSTWPIIFKNIKKLGAFDEQIGKDFAQKCNREYLSKKGKWTVYEIKSMAQKLINAILEHLNVDTTDLFKDVMELENTLEINNLPTIPRFTPTVSFYQQKYSFWIILVIGVISLLFIVFLLILLLKKSKVSKNSQNYYEQPIKTRLLPPKIPLPLTPVKENYLSESDFEISYITGGSDHYDKPLGSSIRRP